jgi:FkbM family methyltransferase
MGNVCPNSVDKGMKILNNALQAIFLFIYRVVNATGVLNTFWGRSLFETAYLFYKTHFEAGTIGLLRNYVKPETSVIDVGANIGFFTLQFAKWITGKAKVIAVEPETLNYARLQRTLARSNLTTVVETVNAAVADTSGEALLELNPLHPGDHKLGPQGVPVAVTTIDSLLEARGWPEISLIKIDVQGAEQRVLTGATKTLTRFQPALFVEVDDQALKKQGSNANALLKFCVDYGYLIHKLNKNTISPALTIEQILQHLKQTRGYMDVLLLPTEYKEIHD